MKILHTFTLIGIDSNGDPLTPQNCNECLFKFISSKDKIDLYKAEGNWHLKTKNGRSELSKHPTQNYYECVSDGVKVQVSMKKMTAEVRAWY